ncbi:MAG: electron transporter RnfG [Ignavibacteriae bacterium HGW-Ignavibacteriae-1]|jgi:electron transport complex protein RnfG|nr:MAG: electron transporter RnfG [Ignavibacteriae bacterium HGW-Ignavibacteriae-1]
MNTVVKMLLTLAIVGIISGASLSEISNWAEPKIAEHRKRDTEKAIFLVQKDAKSYDKIEDAPFELYTVADEQGNMIGYALPYEGNGFQGKVRIMIGIDPEITKILAIEVLEQVETPGLGTKITEEPFTKQFIDLNCNPNIESVKGAPPSKDNQIQSITGATISSVAVVKIMNDGLESLRKYKKSGAKS